MAHAGSHSSAAPDGGAYLQISPLASHDAHSSSYSRAGPRLTPPQRPTAPAIGTQRHARRLQLRHTGFPALFPGRNHAAARRSSTPSISQTGATQPREHDPSPERSNAPQHSGSPPSPSILQEINNQATVRRVTGRSLLSSIFHHSSRGSLSNADFAIFDDESTDASQLPQIQLESAIHEMPGAAQASHVRRNSARGLAAGKLRQRPRKSGPSADFDAADYIEHLEAELVSVNSKLDSLASPSLSRSQSAKLRALNKQAQSLHKEVSDWERKFDERVQEHIFDQKRIEASLKAKIHELRDEVDARDLQLSDMQHELEAIHEKLAASTALETDMNRRIDVLTQLLAQSPTRLNFASTSPMVAADNTKRGRPSSMILPNAQTLAFEPGQREGEFQASNNRGARVMESPSLARRRSELLWTQMLPLSGSLESGELAALPESDQLLDMATDRAMSDTSRVFTELSSMQSPASSRPTSLMSNSSVWSAWGLPAQAETPSRTDSKSRRMRRFVTGSNALKPLLLPTSSGITEPNSPSGESPVWRDPSETADSFAEVTGTFMNNPQREDGHESHALPEDQTITPQPAKGRTITHGLGVATPVLGQVDEHFYRRLLTQNTPVFEHPNSAPSPTMASSPLIDMSWTASKMTTEGPSTPARCGKSMTHESSPTSTAGRTVRIQTPNSNLDALLMNETPSKTPREPFLREELQDVDASFGSTPIPRSKLSIYAPLISDSCVERIARLVLSLKRETLHNMKAVLVSSWARGSSGFGAFGWWLFGLVKSSKHMYASGNPSHGYEKKSRNHRHGSTDMTLPSSGLVVIPEEQFFGMPWYWRSSGKSYFAQTLSKGPTQHCPDCMEPALRRNLRLWCKLSLTIVLALGIALLHGPEEVLNERENKFENKLRTRKSCPELTA